MKEYKVLLDSLDKVKEFVEIMSRYPFDVDLCSERYIIDAKSIMGVFSLDISKALVLKAHSDERGNFDASIEKFLCN